MTNRILPTPELLRELLTYDPETGKLFWKPRPAEMFATPRAFGLWNTRFAGMEAMTSVKGSGYRHGKIFTRPHLAHRVIWAMEKNEWPAEQIDHIDTDKLNNRIDNLRPSGHAGNMRNQGLRKNNSSGYKGVDFDIRCGKYRAQISVNSKKMFLGYFSSAESAHVAYCSAAEAHHGEFARTE